MLATAIPSDDLTLDPNRLRFFSGRSHPDLAGRIAAYLSVPLDLSKVPSSAMELSRIFS